MNGQGRRRRGGRKPTWKEFHLLSYDDLLKMKSTQGSNRGAWKDFTVYWYSGGGCETNLPWDELRLWFTHSGVRMPSQILRDTVPSWFVDCTCEKGAAIPEDHDPDCEVYTSPEMSVHIRNPRSDV